MTASSSSTSERCRRGNWAGLPTVLLATAVSSLGTWAACLPAAAAPTFTNVTAAIGVTHTHTVAGSLAYMSAGVAAADFDGDGLVDLFFTQLNRRRRSVPQHGERFRGRVRRRRLHQVLPTNGVAAGDIDNDGDLDLCMMGTNRRVIICTSTTAAGHFTEDAIARGADVSRASQRTKLGRARRRLWRLRRRRLSRHADHRPQPTDGDQWFAAAAKSWRRESGHFEDVTHAAGLDVYRQARHQSAQRLSLPAAVQRPRPRWPTRTL